MESEKEWSDRMLKKIKKLRSKIERMNDGWNWLSHD